MNTISSENKLFGISIKRQSKKNILEEIKKYLSSPKGFFHVVSLNPENVVVSYYNDVFKDVLETAQIKIIDGSGIVLAAQILGVPIGERLTGVELMEGLLGEANRGRLRVLFLGGKPNLANDLANCYSQLQPEAKFLGIEGIKNIERPQKDEEEKIFSIVADYKPHLLFASFGSPSQELWLARHSNKLEGIVCMGVGGAFDYLAGSIVRAPGILRKIGLEWLFRLIMQPWRWRRQLRLITFAWLVLKEKLKS